MTRARMGDGIRIFVACLGFLCALVLAAAYANAATPVFLVKSGDVIDGKKLAIVAGPEILGHVSVNNRGDIAFLGWWDSDNDGIAEQRGIFTPQTLLVAQGASIGGRVLLFLGFPSINESGTVAFLAVFHDEADGLQRWGVFTQHEVVVQEGQTVAGVVVEKLRSIYGNDYPIVNDAGEVAFLANLNETPDPSCGTTTTGSCTPALMTQHRVLVREGDSIGGYTVSYLLAANTWGFPLYDFNATADVAVIATTAPDDKLALLAGAQWVYRAGQTIEGHELRSLSDPVINDLGQVAVSGEYRDAVGVDHWYLLGRDGVIRKEGDVVDGFVLESIGDVASINNVGEIVFSARYRDGAMLKRGWFTQYRFLTPMTTTIDGVEVYFLVRPKINDAGDVVMPASWDADGDGDPRLDGSGIVLFANNRPPVAVCANVVVSTQAGVCIANASVDGGSFDPDGDPLSFLQAPPPPYPLGQTPVTLTATDTSGASNSCSGRVEVVDREPPRVEAVTASPNTLWPPDRRMVPVQVTVQTSDNCRTAVCSIVSVRSSEPAPGARSTVHEPDWAITEPLSVSLRAERSGTGAGRVYSVQTECTDSAGNRALASVEVRVPHYLQP